MAMTDNGVVWEFRTSQYLPNDPPTWYRCNSLSVFSPIAQAFFKMALECKPETIVKL
jgi:hypothetical protein